MLAGFAACAWILILYTVGIAAEPARAAIPDDVYREKVVGLWHQSDSGLIRYTSYTQINADGTGWFLVSGSALGKTLEIYQEREWEIHHGVFSFWVTRTSQFPIKSTSGKQELMEINDDKWVYKLLTGRQKGKELEERRAKEIGPEFRALISRLSTELKAVPRKTESTTKSE